MNYQSNLVYEMPVEHRKILSDIQLNRPKWLQTTEQLFYLAILTDLIVLNCCFYWFFSKQPNFHILVSDYFPRVAALFLFINAGWIFVTSYTKVYRILEGVKLVLRIQDLFTGTLIFFGLMGLLFDQFFNRTLIDNFLFPTFLFFTIFSSLTHLILRKISLKKVGYFSYIVVGGNSNIVKKIQKDFRSIYGENAVFLGQFSNSHTHQIKNLGADDELQEFLKVHKDKVNKLIYISSSLSRNNLKSVLETCKNQFINFELIPEFMEYFENGYKVENTMSMPIIKTNKKPLDLFKNKFLKRSFDILFAFFVIVGVFSWLFPLIAIIIKLESKGPIFFVQKRSGLWNRPFYCLKFRSMAVNKDSDSKQATRNDKRITRFGAFLRKSSLDEMPQFFNVFLGQMSVVGPRPHMLKHTEEYSSLIDNFMLRHEVKPGITGWAQVNGWRGPTEELYKMEKRVVFDIQYIENWSFWLDLKNHFNDGI